MSNNHQTQSGWGVTIGTRAEARGFTSVYESVEKNTAAYEPDTWVCTHGVCARCEGHNMIHTLLTGCTVCVCQY
jgi:hypothetical protein